MKQLGSWPYSRQYTPPAPLVDLELQEDPKTRFVALLDSGADITVLAYRKAVESGVSKKPPISAAYLIGPDFAGMAPIFLLRIRIGEKILEAGVAVAETREEAIIGRDVLNNLRITLDGPSETVTIHGPSSDNHSS